LILTVVTILSRNSFLQIDDDDQEAEQFMASDIDQLLMRSSKQVTYGANATSSIGSGLGSFSKASFVTSTESGEKDVDLDDPDFWTKAVGLDAPQQELPEELASMLDDGVKRVRKQVQQYDPYADIAKSEQMKKERIAAEKLLEKERLKEEKKKKKLLEIEEKRRKKEEKEKALKAKIEKDELSTSVISPVNVDFKNAKMIPKLLKESKPKKAKKSDRSRTMRRVANADPVIEKIKQAWEIPQRNRVTAAIIRFGFGRFTKMRSEANLNSIPLQDVEVFSRSYMLFQY
jgi:hypothetical protein